jgi:hypothetical protein
MPLDEKETTFKFDVTGTFSIQNEFEQVLSQMGEITGFKLPNGKTVQLVVALEVASENEESFEYITSEEKMGALGFRCLDYIALTFTNEDEG